MSSDKLVLARSCLNFALKTDGPKDHIGYGLWACDELAQARIQLRAVTKEAESLTLECAELREGLATALRWLRQIEQEHPDRFNSDAIEKHVEFPLKDK